MDDQFFLKIRNLHLVVHEGQHTEFSSAGEQSVTLLFPLSLGNMTFL